MKATEIRTLGVHLGYALLHVSAGRAVRGFDHKKQLLTRRAQVPQPPALHHPAAMHAAPWEEHVKLVAPELRNQGLHRSGPI